ncbi:hypothetical protein [Pseudoxanthomonas sp.]|uniref:hypothetical protein n=1 Tax=Pseudoxanthomonas sp. TaxID=1871049 RepID=UPI002FE26EA1
MPSFMASGTSRHGPLAVSLATVAPVGCFSYIKREELDGTIAERRATDQRPQSQVDALSQKHGALVARLAGRIRIETGAHFATDDATPSGQDTPLPGDFARVIRDSHAGAIVAIEGFADPSGPGPARTTSTSASVAQTRCRLR